MIYIKNFIHDVDSSTITFEVERDGVTNHIETRDTGYGTTSIDINDFTEDWSDSENGLQNFATFFMTMKL